MSLPPRSKVTTAALRLSSLGVLAVAPFVAPFAAPLASPLAAQVPVGVGTRVPVSLTTELSSKSADKGAKLPLQVDADVTVGGQVVIAKGAPVFGTVTEAKKAGRFGHAGVLAITVDSVQGADGHMIAAFADLRDTTVANGSSGAAGKAATKLASMVPGGDLVAGAFKKGEDVTYLSGTPIPVYTAAYVMVQVPGAPAVATPAPAPAAASGDTSAPAGPAPEALAFYNSMHTLELTLGALAAHMSGTPEVRAFGEQVIREDTALVSEARALGARYNTQLAPPTKDEQDKINAVVKSLRALSGKAFDAALMQQLYELEHNFTDGLDGEDATPLGPLLVKTAPVWKGHMEASAKLLVAAQGK